MDKTQRDFLLRQQLAAIRKELGESGDDEDVIEGYRAKLEEGQLPDDGPRRDRRARSTGSSAPVSRAPSTGGSARGSTPRSSSRGASAPTTSSTSVEARATILDADHTGLDDVKDRIVEYLAVRKLRAERGMTETGWPRRGAGAILALVGPPGVGKTSLGESVARALGRKFVRVALGGVHDEAELRGHRRTYVGARPGRIVRAITEAGTMNPVIVLDEVDKSGADWRGDPSSALLEVLDPAQNHTFRDHYLEIDLDLSDVLFLATANVVETIPGPLLDRLEVIRLDGYTEDEKVAIARDHLLARQLERNGLTADDVSVSDEALRRSSSTTRVKRACGTSSGSWASCCARPRRGSRRVRRHRRSRSTTTTSRLRSAGAKFFAEVADRTSVPGVATGLAVTGTGGDVLFIEANTMDGEGLTLTGQLGDVMKESAQIALSYVQAHATELGIEPDRTQRRFHLHVPAGAIPKDGPSAGVTMTTALVSLLTGRPCAPGVGMTGEVTLQGRVLPIGGVKQKVLAAQRAGLDTVILPKRNGPDLDDVPEAVRDVDDVPPRRRRPRRVRAGARRRAQDAVAA